MSCTSMGQCGAGTARRFACGVSEFGVASGPGEGARVARRAEAAAPGAPVRRVLKAWIRVAALFAVAVCGLLGGEPACAGDAATAVQPLGDRFRLRMTEPVVVAMAPAGEKRWGQYQFVSLSVYPGGRILLRFHAGEDSVRAYGSGEPAFLSSDQGRSWAAFQEGGLPGAGLVCESLLAVGPSEFLAAYTDFEHLDAQGLKRKAILVRRLSVDPM